MIPKILQLKTAMTLTCHLHQVITTC